MGWSIWTVYNFTEINGEDRKRFNDLAGDNYHDLYEEGGGPLEFDGDAMEHADYLTEPWALAFFEEIKLNGTVIFTGDGEARGKHWGYRFENGKVNHLDQKECMRVLMEDER